MSDNLLVRPATRDDVAEIVRQRCGMYRDMDYTDEVALATMACSSEAYLGKALGDGTFRAWMALASERVAGGGAVLISPWPSHPYDLECRRATILNVYTYPEFRRKGVARRLMETMIAWCRKQNFAGITLHASKDGRHLYESLGFETTNEMRLKLR